MFYNFSTDVETVNDITDNFFHLPEPDKLRYQRKVNNFGYDSIGSEK